MKQIFIIHRHGARYSITKPSHNFSWPSLDDYWESHCGKLSPVGVHQMTTLGQKFRKKYPWANLANTTIISTKYSRALESAWSLAIGLFPDYPIKIQEVPKIKVNGSSCLVQFNSKSTFFGKNKTPKKTIQQNIYQYIIYILENDERVKNLAEKLISNPNFKWKTLDEAVYHFEEIYHQIKIDRQLGRSDKIIKSYGITPEDIELMREVSMNTMNRRFVPWEADVHEKIYNSSCSRGIRKYIEHKLSQELTQNSLTIFSCHDTTILSFLTSLGIIAHSPEFCGHIVIEREDDQVSFYYYPEPFEDNLSPKKWSCKGSRDHYVLWENLEDGIFTVDEFLSCLKK